jgi:Cd2+/Zn2+-exporting ATPase/Cu+-exporting ATPase
MNRPNLKEPEISTPVESHQSNDATGHGGHEDDSEHAHPLDWREIARVLFVAAAAGAMWFVGRSMNPYITAIGVFCTIAGGFPIFREAYENVTQRRMTMELSMAIAIVAALAIREIFTALVITLFVLVAEILEGLTVGRGRKAIQHLVDLLPSVATVRRSGSWIDVEIGNVTTDDEVLVRPGGRIPVDGKVVGGHSFVDQAPITGESMPVEKHPGAIVYAGTINQSGALEVRVERWAVIRPSEKSLRQLKRPRNPERRSRELRTDSPVILFILRWERPSLLFSSATTFVQPFRLSSWRGLVGSLLEPRLRSWGL